MDKINYKHGTLVSLEFLLKLSETLDDYNFGQILEFFTEQYGIVWESCSSIGNSLAVSVYSHGTGYDSTGGFSDANSFYQRTLVVHPGWAIVQKYINIYDQDGTLCESRLVPVMIHVPQDTTYTTAVLPEDPDIWTLYIDYDETNTCPYGAVLCSEEDALRKQKSFLLELVSGEGVSENPPGKIALAYIEFSDTTALDGFRKINSITDIRENTNRYIFKSAFVCVDDISDSTEWDFINDAHILHFNTTISCCRMAGIKNHLLDDYNKTALSGGIDNPHITQLSFITNKGASPLLGMAILEPVGPFQGSAAFFDTDIRNAIKNTSFTWTYNWQFIEEKMTDQSMINSGVDGWKYVAHVNVTNHGFRSAWAGWYRTSYTRGIFDNSFSIYHYYTHWWTFYGDLWGAHLPGDLTNYDTPPLCMSDFKVVRDAYLHPYGSKWLELGGYEGIVSGHTYIVGKPQGYLIASDESLFSNFDTDSLIHILPVPWLFYDCTSDIEGSDQEKIYWDCDYISSTSGGDWRISRLLTGSYDSIHLFNTFSDAVFDKDCNPNPGYRYSRLAKHVTAWAYIKGEYGQNVIIRILKVTHPASAQPWNTHDYTVIASQTITLTQNGPQIISATFNTVGSGNNSLGLNPNDGDTNDYRYAVEIINANGTRKLYVMAIQVVPGYGSGPFLPHFGFIPEWNALASSIKNTIRGWDPTTGFGSVSPYLEPPWCEGSWFNALSYWDIISNNKLTMANAYNDVQPLLSPSAFRNCFLWYEVKKGLGYQKQDKFTFSAWIRFRPITEFYKKAGPLSSKDQTLYDEYPTIYDKFIVFTMANTTSQFSEDLCDETGTLTVTDYITLYRRKKNDGYYYLTLAFSNGINVEYIDYLIPDQTSVWYNDYHLVTATWDLENGTAMLLIDNSYQQTKLLYKYRTDYLYISLGGWNPYVDINGYDFMRSGQFWADEILCVNKFIGLKEHSYFKYSIFKPFGKETYNATLTSYAIGQYSKQIVSNPFAYHILGLTASYGWNWYGLRNQDWDSPNMSDIGRYHIFSVPAFRDIANLPVIGFTVWNSNLYGTCSSGVGSFWGYRLGYSSPDGTHYPINWKQFRKDFTGGFCNPGLFEMAKKLITPNTVDIEYNIFININTINSYYTGRHDSANSSYYPDQTDTGLRDWNDYAEYYIPKRIPKIGTTNLYWRDVLDIYNVYAPHNLTMVTFGTLIPYRINVSNYKTHEDPIQDFSTGHIEARIPHQYGEAIFGSVFYHTIHRFTYALGSNIHDKNTALAEPSRTNSQNNIRDGLLIPFNSLISVSSWFASDQNPIHTGTMYNPDATDISHGSLLAQTILTPLDETSSGVGTGSDFQIYYGPQFRAGLIEQYTQNNIIVNVWDLTPAFYLNIFSISGMSPAPIYVNIRHPVVRAITVGNIPDGNLIENTGWDFDTIKSVSIQMIGVSETLPYYRWWTPGIGPFSSIGG